MAIIPHTAAVTTLGSRKPGDAVNLEVDMVAKYIERLLERKAGPTAATDGALMVEERAEPAPVNGHGERFDASVEPAPANQRGQRPDDRVEPAPADGPGERLPEERGWTR